MRHELLRILVAVADPLCRLEPVKSRVHGHDGNDRAHRDNTASKIRPKRLTPSAPDWLRSDGVSQENSGRLSSIISEVAAKWWLLFTVRP